MSRKRNRNRKAWAKKRQSRGPTRQRSSSRARTRPAWQPAPPGPTELDQVAVVIPEEMIGLDTTSLAGLQELSRGLPFEPSVSVLSMLAGRVEATVNQPRKQIVLAEEFFGTGELIERYRAVMNTTPNAHVFGPQSLYTLIRILVEDSYDAPITQELTPDERSRLLRAVIASNSVIEVGLDASVGSTPIEILAYELQAGGYYARPPWMEELTRHHELYTLATRDPELVKSADFEDVERWIERSGLTAAEQWMLGFALSATTSAWEPSNHPHVPPGTVAEILARAKLSDRSDAALAVLSADRHELKAAFAALKAEGNRYIWELRPFNTWPFLRLQAEGGLLVLGRPWTVNWLSQGFHYRAMRQAQVDDATAADGRANHVQRYTAYAGQVFEKYCLQLAEEAIDEGSGLVLGEQAYGKGGGQKTSDVAVMTGHDLILFECNARRVGAEPLVTGDPLDATNELTKLLVKKINQLGGAVGALLAGDAALPGIDIGKVDRIFPVVVSAGHVWQTSTLWDYLMSARDDKKCEPLDDGRVAPLQVLDAADYEKLLGLAEHGNNIAELLARKTAGPYQRRDLAVWLNEDAAAPDRNVRLAAIESAFEAMTSEMKSLFEPKN